ncbi:hypothetical protein DFH09DRAFT_274549 [Mycena vulgaris]|nr:hypothetical protein DFH09DRAFT_274549 [Mycena vulgaris]
MIPRRASPISTLVMHSCNLSLLFSFCTGFRHLPGTVLRSRVSDFTWNLTYLQLMSKPTHHLSSSMGVVSSSLYSLYLTDCPTVCESGIFSSAGTIGPATPTCLYLIFYDAIIYAAFVTPGTARKFGILLYCVPQHLLLPIDLARREPS